MRTIYNIRDHRVAKPHYDTLEHGRVERKTQRAKQKTQVTDRSQSPQNRNRTTKRIMEEAVSLRAALSGTDTYLLPCVLKFKTDVSTRLYYSTTSYIVSPSVISCLKN